MSEGAAERDNHICFIHYNGEYQPKHDWFKNKCEAVLQNPSKMEDIKDGRNEQIKSQFLEFMNQVNKRKDYPQIKLEVRFGKIYYYKKPKDVTSVAELSELEVSGVASGPRSAFQPLHMSHQAVEGFLNENGYQMTSTETVFAIYLKGEVKRVDLNEQFNIEEVKSEYKKHLTINIKRMDRNKKDYRFILSEEKVLSSDDPVTEKYKRKEIIKRKEDDLFVTEEFINGFKMVRQKTTEKFSKDGAEGEVRLVKVKEHFKPNRQGRFTRVKPWREEVVIKYKVPEKGTDSDYASFIQEVMKLSYKLQEVEYESTISEEK